MHGAFPMMYITSQSMAACGALAAASLILSGSHAITEKQQPEGPWPKTPGLSDIVDENEPKAYASPDNRWVIETRRNNDDMGWTMLVMEGGRVIEQTDLPWPLHGARISDAGDGLIWSYTSGISGSNYLPNLPRYHGISLLRITGGRMQDSMYIRRDPLPEFEKKLWAVPSPYVDDVYYQGSEGIVLLSTTDTMNRYSYIIDDGEEFFFGHIPNLVNGSFTWHSIYARSAGRSTWVVALAGYQLGRGDGGFCQANCQLLVIRGPEILWGASLHGVKVFHDRDVGSRENLRALRRDLVDSMKLADGLLTIVVQGTEYALSIPISTVAE